MKNQDEIFQELRKAFKQMKMSDEKYRNYFMSKPHVEINPSYAIIRFLNARLESGRIGFKTAEQDEKMFSNMTYIEKQKEICLHVRTPLKDEWHKLFDYVDIDVYLPIAEIEKICEFAHKVTPI